MLDVASGSNDLDSEESSESEDESDELESTKVPPSTAPPPKTSNVNLASSKPAKKAKAVKTGLVKKPLDAVALT